MDILNWISFDLKVSPTRTETRTESIRGDHSLSRAEAQQEIEARYSNQGTVKVCKIQWVDIETPETKKETGK